VKTQFIFLLVVLSLNLTIMMCFSLEDSNGDPLIPGVRYMQPINASGDFDDYADRFNATEIMEEWQATPFDGVPILGDIFSQGNQFVNAFGFLIDGVPSLLTWMGSFLPTAESVFALVANVIRVITAVLSVTLIIELIGGRELLP
jgi:hypothetical protein